MPACFAGWCPRLETFLEPFVKGVAASVEQKTNVTHYVSGLMSDLDSKDAESIAYLHDRERQGLQKFIGQAEWNHRPPLDELARGRWPASWGRPMACSSSIHRLSPNKAPNRWVCSGSGAAGSAKLRIARWAFTLAMSRVGNMRWSTCGCICPRYGANRKQPQEGRRAGRDSLPHPARADAGDARRARVRCCRMPGSCGDDELGRSSWFRGQLRSRNEHYLLAVPSNTLVRDLTSRCPILRTAAADHAQRFRSCVSIAGVPESPESSRETIEVRDGEKGPLATQAVRRLVRAPKPNAGIRGKWRSGWWSFASDSRTARGNAELLAGRSLRCRRRLGTLPVSSRAQHRIEESLKRAKGEGAWPTIRCGRGRGWHHHQTAFVDRNLVPPRRRPGGEKIQTPALTVPQLRALIAGVLNRHLGCYRIAHIRRTATRRLRRNEEARLYHWKRRNRLPPRRFEQRE